MPETAGERVAEKMGGPFFRPFLPFRPLFPIEKVNVIEIFFFIMVKAVNIHNWKSFTTTFLETTLKKFDNI